MENNNKLRGVFLNWNQRLPILFENYLYNENKDLLFLRSLYFNLSDIIKRFLNNSVEELEKIILLTGIRGTGKTTLLFQLMNFEKYQSGISNSNIFEKVFLDVGKLVNEGFSLNDFFNFYEKEREIIYENTSKKIVFVLDEVHYDKNWGLTLKNFFDSTKGNKNLIVFATGSSSLKLKLNPDLSRRSTLFELYPLNYGEFLKLKYGFTIETELSNNLANEIIDSKNAAELFAFLKSKKLEVETACKNFPLNSMDEFLIYGGFPVNLFSRQKAFENIKAIIDNIILKDILTIKEFRTSVVSQINLLIYLLANSDVISLEKIKKSVNITDNRTINRILESIKESGLITKLLGYGSAYSSARKSPKILFNSPCLRTALLDGIIPTGLEGKKLEEYFILIYNSIFKNINVRDINYDPAVGGADFIIKKKDATAIVVEIGFDKNKTDQIKRSFKKVKAKYGIVFGSTNLELEDNNIVKIPLNYLFLL